MARGGVRGGPVSVGRRLSAQEGGRWVASEMVTFPSSGGPAILLRRAPSALGPTGPQATASSPGGVPVAAAVNRLSPGCVSRTRGLGSDIPVQLVRISEDAGPGPRCASGRAFSPWTTEHSGRGAHGGAHHHMPTYMCVSRYSARCCAWFSLRPGRALASSPSPCRCEVEYVVSNL